MHVTRMRPEEADRTARLIERTIRPLSYYTDRAKAEELARLSASGLTEMIASDPDSVLVAREGDAIIGFCTSLIDSGLLWLDWFGVDERSRERGVGRSLLAALEATAEPRGCHKLWCDSRTDNLPSRQALTQAGYTELCTVTNHWYGLDYILWERRIR